jgi:hypothetical protein
MADAERALAFLTSHKYLRVVRYAYERGCVVVYDGEAFEITHSTETERTDHRVCMSPADPESQPLILQAIKIFLESTRARN